MTQGNYYVTIVSANYTIIYSYKGFIQMPGQNDDNQQQPRQSKGFLQKLRHTIAELIDTKSPVMPRGLGNRIERYRNKRGIASPAHKDDPNNTDLQGNPIPIAREVGQEENIDDIPIAEYTPVRPDTELQGDSMPLAEARVLNEQEDSNNWQGYVANRPETTERGRDS